MNGASLLSAEKQLDISAIPKPVNADTSIGQLCTRNNRDDTLRNKRDAKYGSRSLSPSRLTSQKQTAGTKSKLASSESTPWLLNTPQFDVGSVASNYSGLPVLPPSLHVASLPDPHREHPSIPSDSKSTRSQSVPEESLNSTTNQDSIPDRKSNRSRSPRCLNSSPETGDRSLSPAVMSQQLNSKQLYSSKPRVMRESFPADDKKWRVESATPSLTGSEYSSVMLNSIEVTKTIMSRSRDSSSKLKRFTDQLVTNDFQPGTSSESLSMSRASTSSMHSRGSQDSTGYARKRSSKSPKISPIVTHMEERSTSSARQLGTEYMCRSVPNLTDTVRSVERQHDSSSVEHLFSRPASYHKSTSNDFQLLLGQSSRSSSVPSGLADTLRNIGRKDSSLMARRKMRRSVQCSTANEPWAAIDFQQGQGLNDPMYSRISQGSIAMPKPRIPVTASHSLSALGTNEQLVPIQCNLLSNQVNSLPRGKRESLHSGEPHKAVLDSNKNAAEFPNVPEHRMASKKYRSRSTDDTVVPDQTSSKSDKTKQSRSLSPSALHAAPIGVSLLSAQSSEHEVSDVPKQGQLSLPRLPKGILKGTRSMPVPEFMSGTSSSNDYCISLSSSSRLLISSADHQLDPNDSGLVSNETNFVPNRKLESFQSMKSLDPVLAADGPVVLSQLDSSLEPGLYKRSRKSRSRSTDDTAIPEKIKSKSGKKKPSRSVSPSALHAAPTGVSLRRAQSSEHKVPDAPKEAQLSLPRLRKGILKGARSMSMPEFMSGTSSSEDYASISSSSQSLILAADEQLGSNDLSLFSNQAKFVPRRKKETFRSMKSLDPVLAAEDPVVLSQLDSCLEPGLYERSIKSRSRSTDDTAIPEKIKSRSGKKSQSRSLSPSVHHAPTDLSLRSAHSSEREVPDAPKEAQSLLRLRKGILKGARSMSVSEFMSGTSSSEHHSMSVSSSSRSLSSGAGEQLVSKDVSLLSNQSNFVQRRTMETSPSIKSLDPVLVAEGPGVLSLLDNLSEPGLLKSSTKSRSRSTDDTVTPEKIKSKSGKKKQSRSLSPSALHAAPTGVSLVNTRRSEHELSEVPKEAQLSLPRLQKATLKGARSVSMPRNMMSSSSSDGSIDRRLTLRMHRSRSQTSKTFKRKKKGKSRSLSPTGIYDEKLPDDSDSLAEIKTFFQELKQARAKSPINDSQEQEKNDYSTKDVPSRKAKVFEPLEATQPSRFKATPESPFPEKPSMLSDDSSGNALEDEHLQHPVLDFSRSRTVKPTPGPGDVKERSMSALGTMPWQEMAQKAQPSWHRQASDQNSQTSLRLEDMTQQPGQVSPTERSHSISPVMKTRCGVHCEGQSEGDLSFGFRDYITELPEEPPEEPELSLSLYLRIMNESGDSCCDDNSMNSTELLNVLNGSVQVDDSIRTTKDDCGPIEPSLSPKVLMSPLEILALLEAENKQDMPERLSQRDSDNPNKLTVMSMAELADILNHVVTRHSNNDEIRWDVIARMAQEAGNVEFDPQRPFEYVGGDATDEDSDISSLSLEVIDSTTDFWNSGGSNQWNSWELDESDK